MADCRRLVKLFPSVSTMEFSMAYSALKTSVGFFAMANYHQLNFCFPVSSHQNFGIMEFDYLL